MLPISNTCGTGAGAVAAAGDVVAPTVAGDNKLLYGQGRPMAKSASGAGADYSTGEESQEGAVTVESRLFFEGTVAGGGAAGDLARLTDARELVAFVVVWLEQHRRRA